MVSIILAVQIIAVVFVLLEVIYIFFQTPSKLQNLFLILGVAVLIMQYGYLAEIRANDVEAALASASFAYIGKTFALLSSALFVFSYCGIRLNKNIVILMALANWTFPVLVITNKFHHLYYSSVEYDRTQVFNPLVLEHGPLYYVYISYMLVAFGLMFFVLAREFVRTKSKEGRKPLLLIAGMMASSVVGYILYAFKLTGGFDTTMAGALVGSGFLTVLFFKYRLLDTLVLAKEKSIENASCGILVLDNRGKEMYKNNEMVNVLNNDFTIPELATYNDTSGTIHKNGNVYEIKVETIINKGLDCGKTIELTDITAKYEYSEKLEREVKERTKKIVEIQRSVISSFANVIEARDSSTGKHVKTIASYVEIIARELRNDEKYKSVVDEKFIKCAVDVAPLHDIGKICIPDSILKKPGRLTDEEFEIIKTHTTKGAKVIEECIGSIEEKNYYNTAIDVAQSHHERWDGRGYPNGLKGEEIPLSARITSIADVYDAIRSERCYKAPMDKVEAKQVIIDGRGTQFCPEVVDAFLRAIDEIEKV